MSFKNIKTAAQIEDEAAAEAATNLADIKKRERQDKLPSALEVLVKVVSPNLSSMPVEDILQLAPLFPDWEPGVAYKDGDRLTYEGVVLEVVSDHTSQADWLPDELPALYTAYRPVGEVSVWVQPTGAQDAYSIGELVTHDNPNDSNNIWVYESKINANTTEPGRDGTFDRWWLPVRAA